MSRERRVVREIKNESGTLTSPDGKSVNVKFSLTQWQNYDADVPTLRSAEGSIRFSSLGDGYAATMDGTPKILKGGGIQAKVIVVSQSRFKVTGPIEDI
jgi:hypothetical protein